MAFGFTKYLMANDAVIDPAIPVVGPRTPASEQLFIKKGGGGSGNGQIKNYGNTLKFIPNRWYEQYAQGGG